MIIKGGLLLIRTGPSSMWARSAERFGLVCLYSSPTLHMDQEDNLKLVQTTAPIHKATQNGKPHKEKKKKEKSLAHPQPHPHKPLCHYGDATT